MNERDRPVIEITREMRKVGEAVIDEYEGSASRYELVELVYTAMERQRIAERR